MKPKIVTFGRRKSPPTPLQQAPKEAAEAISQVINQPTAPSRQPDDIAYIVCDYEITRRKSFHVLCDPAHRPIVWYAGFWQVLEKCCGMNLNRVRLVARSQLYEVTIRHKGPAPDFVGPVTNDPPWDERDR